MSNRWKIKRKSLASWTIALLLTSAGSAALAQDGESGEPCAYEGEFVCLDAQGEEVEAVSAQASADALEDGTCAKDVIIEASFEDAACQGTFTTTSSNASEAEEMWSAIRDGQYDRRDLARVAYTCCDGQYDRRDISIILNDRASND